MKTVTPYLLQHFLTNSAIRFPEREALRFKGQGMSYAQLDALTNQVARSLRQAGVGRGDRVGIYLHKSPASVISIFGILKAGGVYVPLDANAPAPRLAYITRNCDIRVLLISGEKMKSLPELLAEETTVEVAVLADDTAYEAAPLPADFQLVSWDEIGEQISEPVPAVGVIEADLAYILYTSGSTGIPKGVMIAHRTIFTFINWCVDRFEMTENDRVTSHAPIHFDLSTFDIFATIKAGGTVVLVPDTLSVFPIQVVRLLQDEKITMTYMVPSILSMMVNYGKISAHDLSSLRTILFAGEVFPIKFLRRLVEMVPHPDYFNLYGPTETNVCTYYKVQPKDLAPERTEPVPIGIACENMEVFAVADEGGLVTEPGKVGELWARGSCVAQGYWGDTEKTAKGFVENSFQPYYRELSYRTGDLVVLDEDGVNWIYVGRRDHMVKSRGYRIELGEIESVLYSHELVREAVVVAIPDDLVGNRIKAFVVPGEKAQLEVSDLEVFCRGILPRYMVPQAFEFMDRLPKTSTGKVDRKSLVEVK